MKQSKLFCPTFISLHPVFTEVGKGH